MNVEEHELLAANAVKDDESDMFRGLSILHIACVFDQEQIITYFIRYGNSVLKCTTKSGQTLLHTCAWFGTSNAMTIIANHGYNTCARNAKEHQPLHLAVLRCT